jgi:hypothetical protein
LRAPFFSTDFGLCSIVAAFGRGESYAGSGFALIAT